MEKVKVVYIMGYGRSGSTLLDICIGAHSDYESLGEISNLHSSVVEYDEYISNGVSFSNHEVYSRLLRKVFKTEKERKKYKQDYDKNVGLSLINTLSFLFSSKRRQIDNNIMLYNNAILIELASNFGDKILVDSSKSFLRANLLLENENISLKVVYLRRELSGVYNSLKKSYSKDIKNGITNPIAGKKLLEVSAKWFIVNLACLKFLSKLNRKDYCTVDYADFIEDPAKSLKKIYNLNGNVKNLQTDSRLFDVGNNIVAGNRLRLQSRIHVEYDGEWQIKLRSHEKLLCYFFEKFFHVIHRYYLR